jgi:hypothetical protein
MTGIFKALTHGAVSASVLLWAAAGISKSLSDTKDASTFPTDDLLSETTSTEAQCRTFNLAVWVTVDGKGDCIRFYAANLRPEGNAKALVFFHGDVLAGRRILSGYERESPASVQKNVADWSAQAGGLPFLFLGRPGAYGSSGDHSQRRRPREARLMTAALDAIKSRYRIGQYYLAGQSGGGTITAAMLNMRSDVDCAVISSGNVAVWRRIQLLNQGSSSRSPKDTTGYTDSYDPVDHVSQIRRSPPPRIFVLADRNDTTVPFESQNHYVQQLVRVGLQPSLVMLAGAGAANHSLSYKARPALAWCAQGLPDSEIKRRLETT